jgi:hypothetical protein
MANTEWTESLWKKTIYHLFDRSCEETGFREYCEANPREAIESASGTQLPADVHVSFDISRDAASIPSFSDVFDKHKNATIELPKTKTQVTVSPR